MLRNRRAFDVFHATKMRCEKCKQGDPDLLEVNCRLRDEIVPKHQTCEEFVFVLLEDKDEFDRLLTERWQFQQQKAAA